MSSLGSSHTRRPHHQNLAATQQYRFGLMVGNTCKVADCRAPFTAGRHPNLNQSGSTSGPTETTRSRWHLQSMAVRACRLHSVPLDSPKVQDSDHVFMVEMRYLSAISDCTRPPPSTWMGSNSSAWAGTQICGMEYLPLHVDLVKVYPHFWPANSSLPLTPEGAHYLSRIQSVNSYTQP
ncbi:hypothetical protein BDZ45DRAFT_170701 [Acephala macrosclerotiorum]|nr:hypothetical protein BDZ45DRAFT_170701 [Acephala macrosclerotiorum]